MSGMKLNYFVVTLVCGPSMPRQYAKLWIQVPDGRSGGDGAAMYSAWAHALYWQDKQRSTAHHDLVGYHLALFRD